MGSSPFIRRGAADQIAQHLREQILAGALRSGDPLREADLASTFGVARNTVREALRLLTREGLATHEVHRGVAVRRFTPSEVHDTFGVRRLIEEAAADRAGTLTAPEVAALEAPLRDSEDALERRDLDRLLSLNLEFHRRVAALPQNKRLLQIFDQLTSELQLMVGPIRDDMSAEWLERNRALFELLRSGTAAEFRTAIAAYIADAERAIAERLLDA
jgi:DNA-binding GntR family transcriptional regulator